MSPNKIQFSAFKLYVYSSRQKQKPSICSWALRTAVLVLNTTCCGPADKDPKKANMVREDDWDARQLQQIPNLHLMLCGWSSSQPSLPQHPPHFPALPGFYYIDWEFFLCYSSTTDLWVLLGNLPLL